MMSVKYKGDVKERGPVDHSGTEVGGDRNHSGSEDQTEVKSRKR